jgi:hypothetical protein
LVRLLEQGEIPFAQQGAPAHGVFSVGRHLVNGHRPREVVKHRPGRMAMSFDLVFSL